MTSDEQFKVMMRWCCIFKIKTTSSGYFFGKARVSPYHLTGTTFNYSTREAAVNATYHMVCSEAYMYVKSIENHNDIY